VIPLYDDLPVADGEARCGWGVFGADDCVGRLNLQTASSFRLLAFKANGRYRSVQQSNRIMAEMHIRVPQTKHKGVATDEQHAKVGHIDYGRRHGANSNCMRG